MPIAINPPVDTQRIDPTAKACKEKIYGLNRISEFNGDDVAVSFKYTDALK